MERIDSNHRDAPAALARVLARGGVAVVPTDTIYGLSASLSSRPGYQRILEIKRCESGRRFLHLASSVEMVQVYIVSWGCVSKQRLDAIWPAPLTGVFRAGRRCPEWVGDTIAFRIPASNFLNRAIEILAEPMVSTSVNLTSEAPLNDIDLIEGRIGGCVDLIVKSAEVHGAEPSTIVDYTGERPLLVREGAYVWEGDGNPSN